MFNYPGDIFMNRRHVLHAIGLAAALATGTVQAQSNELKVAIDPTDEPFTYKTPDGKPTPNGCALVRARTSGEPQPPCWCTRAPFSAELLARIPAAARGKACVCAACVGAATSGADGERRG
ncbi:cysteine-rich CWC family protein [Tepidimonas sp.]|uniref:cysteine-rich CWC family protein n=1 Tax=Tepidimonas sp. TaxID=2002775 RepID=UPI0028CC851D|nr:cysteine-rich CWC family protein [Tepidimonas sp.]MDT7929092.1 cysteine-rich CWC family protein [Tepidimonas sp.]